MRVLNVRLFFVSLSTIGNALAGPGLLFVLTNLSALKTSQIVLSKLGKV